MSSVFTKIIKGELPCYKIYEDDLTISILTIAPIQLGHTLVIPKEEIDHYLDVPEPAYLRVFQNAQKIGKAIHKATGCTRVGTMIQGWEVPHFHYHVVPMWGPDDLNLTKARSRDESEMKDIWLKIREALEL